MKTKIYALTEPDGKIRYVGKTYRSLLTRFSQHLSEARIGKTGHRCNWIRSLLEKGLLPKIQFIGEVEGNGSKEEMAWIRYFKDEGIKLVNDTEGGDGTLGYKHTGEIKKRIGICSKGRKGGRLGTKQSPETCKKISIALTNNPIKYWLGKKRPVFSELTRRKMGLAQSRRKVSEETRKKSSISHLKYYQLKKEAVA